MLFSQFSKSTGKRGGTALDRNRAALSEKEKQLRMKSERLQALLQEAPRLREEADRRRHEVLAGDTRLAPVQTSLVDRRHQVSTASVERDFGTRRLRFEKRDGKLLFLFLCFLLLLLTYGIWQVLRHTF